MITHSNVAQRAVNLCKIGRSEWLSYEWFIEKTACIRESLVQRERMLDRWMESVGGKIGRSVNRGGGGGRAARSKEAGTIRGGPSSRFRGASVSPLDRDVTRARRFICHCRSSFHATCHKFVRLVPRFPAPPRAYTWQHFCTTSNERTNLFPRHDTIETIPRIFL